MALYNETLVYRKLDENGDMVMDGMNALLTAQDALMQSIRTRLKLFKGEWWEGDSGAVGLFSELLGKPASEDNRAILEMLITGRISATDGVIEVTDVKSGYEKGRIFKYSCYVCTQYGRSALEVEYD